MNIEKRTMGKTHVTQSFPWGLYTRNGHRLLCADGIIRAAELSATADTFFSVPAKVRIKGKWISGYMTVQGKDNFDSAEELRTWCFRAHTGQGIAEWPSYDNTPGDDVHSRYATMRSAFNAILEKAHY